MAISKATIVILLGVIATAEGAHSCDLAHKLIGHLWRFESHNYPNYFMRHRNYWVRIDKFKSTKLYKLDSAWNVVKGLCGKGISFQAKIDPNYYLRHTNYKARIDRYQNTKLFKMDACFLPRNGLANSKKYSFESANYPGYFLRHFNYWVRIDHFDGTKLFKKDATFDAIAVCPKICLR